MSTARIGIFSYPADEQAQAVLQRVNEMQAGAGRWFDLSLPDTQSFFIDTDALHWNGMDVAALESAYIHGLAYQFPVVPRYYANLDYSVWQMTHVVDQQKYSFLASMMQDMERRGVKVFNSYRSYLRAYERYDLLESIRDAGFNVPDMIYTNDMSAANAFCEQTRDAVWRPGNGRAAWQLFRERQVKAPLSPVEPPVILAETRSGPLVRVFVVNGKPLLYLGMKSPHSAYQMESLETFWQRDDHQLDEVFHALARELAIPCMAVTFVLEDKTPWIYDIDTDPVFNQLPGDIAAYLVEALALSLLGRTDELAPFDRVEQALERPNIFSRGQLCVLFNMEKLRRRPGRPPTSDDDQG